MRFSVCFQASPDLFSSVGPILVLHTPCGAVQWIYIVGEEFAGRHIGKIDGTIGPRFSLLNLVHTPLICLDQDRLDVNKSPK